jgi:acetyl-CoA carboxylase biotin carboxyl carrier protein
VGQDKFAPEELEAIASILDAAPHITMLRIVRGEAEFAVARTLPKAVTAPPPAPSASNGRRSSAVPVVLRSKTVGRFFRGAPGERPFVEPGDSVHADSTIGMIEVVRRSVPVLTGTAGCVVAILANDGQPVEFGQPLATIQPSE